MRVRPVSRAQIEAEAAGSRPPLMYTWHGEKYLGIAHGIAGVVNVLLLRPQELDTAAVTHTHTHTTHTPR
jgi:hypothetical protein